MKNQNRHWKNQYRATRYGNKIYNDLCYHDISGSDTYLLPQEAKLQVHKLHAMYLQCELVLHVLTADTCTCVDTNKVTAPSWTCAGNAGHENCMSQRN